MTSQNFTTAFTVDQTPEEAFKAINNSNAWGSYINGSLKSLITTGKGKPNPKEK
jgi:hypothetical protein